MLGDEMEVKHSEGSIATLGQSWNFSLAENLKSLDLQDGPRSGITFLNSYPPTVNVWDMEYLRNHWSDLHKILNLSLWDLTKIKT